MNILQLYAVAVEDRSFGDGHCPREAALAAVVLVGHCSIRPCEAGHCSKEEITNDITNEYL